ncbi:PUA-like domain-containing protein [Rhypophila decipiens]|uniref:PUA-like domain-containing protein n=1 Tax=Rhypophila decipiens TaxID=261697 RepID=A0AAN6YDN3_9PEZI|nr:PUA-like domain-containing protein [Rhypophila decipiens]
MSSALINESPREKQEAATSRNEDPSQTHSADHHDLSPQQVRQAIRLIQCPVCSLPIHEPYTLPCGRSLCKACIPSPRPRVNVSYPLDASRLQGFDCPFPDCSKDHAVGDCNPDVCLGKILDAFESELIKQREVATKANITSHLALDDGWGATGVPSLRDTDTPSRELAGGLLVASFTLAEEGHLKHGDDVVFTKEVDGQQTAFDSLVLDRIKEAVRPEMECQVCYALFYEPITTSCGHTFCRSCLQRVLDHSKCCPICRRAVTIQPVVHREASPTNQLIEKMILAFWPQLLGDRKQTVLAETRDNGNSGYDIAVFVCTLSFPGMPTFLHVFEPRYRLMIRRALEGNRTFGMVLYDGQGFKELGTLLRIVNCEFFPDGRSLIETVGLSRFRITQHSILDGYIVANIQKISDISQAEEEEAEAAETSRQRSPSLSRDGSPHSGHSSSSDKLPMTPNQLDTTPTNDLMELSLDFVHRMQEQSVKWLTSRILTIYGECPEDPATFPWWFASILPLNDREKYRLLGTRSVRERLKICCGWVMEWERNMW